MTDPARVLCDHPVVLFLAEAAAAFLLGLLVGRWGRAVAVFTILYVLHAIPALLGWYGALSEWDDVPYWVAGFILDGGLVAIGVGIRRWLKRHRQEHREVLEVRSP